jgi:hypothetical protein
MPPSKCASYRTDRDGCNRDPECSYTAPSASRRYCYRSKRSARRRRTAVKGPTKSNRAAVKRPASKPRRRRHTAVKGPPRPRPWQYMTANGAIVQDLDD